MAEVTIHVPTTADKYPTRDQFTDVFTVEVGPPGSVKTFTIHKGVASFYSGFFASALKADTFKEGAESHVKLPEEDVEQFNDFVGWLYTRNVPEPGELSKFGYIQKLFELWVMADRLCIPILANEIINNINDFMEETSFVPSAKVGFVYTNTTPGSPLRRFLIEQMVLSFGPDHIKKMKDENHLPKAAMWDFIDRQTFWMMEVIKDGAHDTPDPNTLDLCDFHIHNEGERCNKI